MKSTDHAAATNKSTRYVNKIEALNKRIEELVLEKSDLNEDVIYSEQKLECISNNLRNASRDLRCEPPNPTTKVSPWMMSTIGPDLKRNGLSIGCGC